MDMMPNDSIDGMEKVRVKKETYETKKEVEGTSRKENMERNYMVVDLKGLLIAAYIYVLF